MGGATTSISGRGSKLESKICCQRFQAADLGPQLGNIRLRILLILSLVNRWDVVTADISSAFCRHRSPVRSLCLSSHHLSLNRIQMCFGGFGKLYMVSRTTRKLWQQHLANKLEELGLRKNKADPCIFMGEKLLVMTYVDDLLIVGEQQEQESFIAKLSAHFPLKHRSLKPKLH